MIAKNTINLNNREKFCKFLILIILERHCGFKNKFYKHFPENYIDLLSYSFLGRVVIKNMNSPFSVFS